MLSTIVIWVSPSDSWFAAVVIMMCPLTFLILHLPLYGVLCLYPYPLHCKHPITNLATSTITTRNNAGGGGTTTAKQVWESNLDSEKDFNIFAVCVVTFCGVLFSSCYGRGGDGSTPVSFFVRISRAQARCLSSRCWCFVVSCFSGAIHGRDGGKEHTYHPYCQDQYDTHQVSYQHVLSCFIVSWSSGAVHGRCGGGSTLSCFTVSCSPDAVNGRVVMGAHCHVL